MLKSLSLKVPPSKFPRHHDPVPCKQHWTCQDSKDQEKKKCFPTPILPILEGDIKEGDEEDVSRHHIKCWLLRSQKVLATTFRACLLAPCATWVRETAVMAEGVLLPRAVPLCLECSPGKTDPETV